MSKQDNKGTRETLEMSLLREVNKLFYLGMDVQKILIGKSPISITDEQKKDISEINENEFLNTAGISVHNIMMYETVMSNHYSLALGGWSREQIDLRNSGFSRSLNSVLGNGSDYIGLNLDRNMAPSISASIADFAEKLNNYSEKWTRYMNMDWENPVLVKRSSFSHKPGDSGKLRYIDKETGAEASPKNQKILDEAEESLEESEKILRPYRQLLKNLENRKKAKAIVKVNRRVAEFIRR